MNLDGRKALTVNEFAAITGLSRATCYRLIDKGHLKAFRFGDSRYLVPMAEVDRIGQEAGYRQPQHDEAEAVRTRDDPEVVAARNDELLTREAPTL